jgi:outer membrane protein OmpA-like peptidoglycan-associated protein
MKRFKTALFAGAMVPVFMAPSFAVGQDTAQPLRPMILAQAEECVPGRDPDCPPPGRERRERRNQGAEEGEGEGEQGERRNNRRNRPAAEDAGPPEDRPAEQAAPDEVPPDEAPGRERRRQERQRPAAEEAAPEEAPPEETPARERRRQERQRPAAEETAPEVIEEEAAPEEAAPEQAPSARERRERRQRREAEEAQPEVEEAPAEERREPATRPVRPTREQDFDEPREGESDAERRLRERRGDEPTAERRAPEETVEPDDDATEAEGGRNDGDDREPEEAVPAGDLQQPEVEQAPAVVEERRVRIDRLREQRRQRRTDGDQTRERRTDEDDADSLQDVRRERRERRENGTVYIEESDGRVIIQNRGGTGIIIRNDESNRMRENARDVEVRRLPNGFEETVVFRRDGTQVITLRDRDGFVIRRTRVLNGRQYVLFSNEPQLWRRPEDLIVRLPPPVIRIPRERYIVEADRAAPELIYETFAAPPVTQVERRYSLDQVVNSPDILNQVRRIDIDSITFQTGSWKVDENQIGALDAIADSILQLIEENPNEVFLVEGHTDAVGSDIDNLTLSDRRAEEVAYLLTEYYDVPAENLTTKGYGERYLKVATEGASRENRRVTMRRITPLLETAQR